jgi:hypothetical protein
MSETSQQQVFTSPANCVSWDEDRSSQDVPRITQGKVKMNLPDLNATASTTYQYVYLPEAPDRAEGSAVYNFTDLIEAEDFKGKKGSFITMGKGTFDKGTYRVEATFEVVVGSGKGELGELFKNGGKGTFASMAKDPTKVEYKFVVA